MKSLSLLGFSFLFTAFLFSFNGANAQEKAKASPADSTTGYIGNSEISIKYNSPSVKNRTIWGALVPYNQVWRAGANEATIFTTSASLNVEGKELPAGTYSFFAIPTEKDWTIIFNKTANQWGAYKYDMGEDALRVTVTPKKSSTVNERLKYEINKNGIVLKWENLEIPVGIK